MSFSHPSSMASHKLKEKQRMLNLPIHNLLIDVVTRWSSLQDVLECFLEQQPAILAALLSPEVCRKESDLCTMIEAEITIAEDAKALDPLKAATLVISKTSPTLSVIEPLHAQQLKQMSKTQHLCDQKPQELLEVLRFFGFGLVYQGYSTGGLRARAGPSTHR